MFSSILAYASTKGAIETPIAHDLESLERVYFSVQATGVPELEQSRRAFQLLGACLTRTRAGKCRMSAETAQLSSRLFEGSSGRQGTHQTSFRLPLT